jgi:hypothetical protein
LPSRWILSPVLGLLLLGLGITSTFIRMQPPVNPADMEIVKDLEFVNDCELLENMETLENPENTEGAPVPSHETI